MKSNILVHFATLIMALHGYAATAKPEKNQDESNALDPTPYGWDRYGKLTSNNPFVFDKTPPPPAPAVDQFADWGIVGVSKHTDSSSVTIVNLKTSERVRLFKGAGAGIVPAKSNAKKSTDTYTLEDLKFEEGKPQLIRHAIATVTKNGAMGTVKYSDQAVKVVKAANPNPALPKPGNPVTPPLGGRPGAPGGGTAAGSNPVMNMIQNQNPGGATPQAPHGAGSADPPHNPPTVPAAPRPVSGVQTPPGSSPATTNNTPVVRRRVVLPDSSAQPPVLNTTPHNRNP